MMDNIINDPILRRGNVKALFENIKYCKFSTLRNLTLEAIVEAWEVLKTDKNENIRTIRYFVKHPEILRNEVIVYNEDGLADGYHRLTAMTIVGQKRCKYIIDNITIY